MTLGTLAAGLAHEINNPASAATRAVDSLEGELESMLSSLRELDKCEISKEQFAALTTLRRELAGASAGLDPLAQADLEDELAAWLRGHGVAPAVFAAARASCCWISER